MISNVFFLYFYTALSQNIKALALIVKHSSFIFFFFFNFCHQMFLIFLCIWNTAPPQNIKALALIGKYSHFDLVFQRNINPENTLHCIDIGIAFVRTLYMAHWPMWHLWSHSVWHTGTALKWGYFLSHLCPRSSDLQTFERKHCVFRSNLRGWFSMVKYRTFEWKHFVCFWAISLGFTIRPGHYPGCS